MLVSSLIVLISEPLHALELAGVDRVAQRSDRLVAREAAPPGQHDAARGHRLAEGDVDDMGLRLLGHRELGHDGDAHARSHHVLDRLERGALEALAYALGVAGKA